MLVSVYVKDENDVRGLLPSYCPSLLKRTILQRWCQKGLGLSKENKDDMRFDCFQILICQKWTV